MSLVEDRTRDAMHRMAGELHPQAAMPAPIRRRVHRRQMRTAGAVSASVVGVALVIVVGTSVMHPSVPRPRPPAPATTPTFQDLVEGWTRLPAPPEVRSGATFVWAGDRLLMLGGSAPGSDSGTATAFELGPVGDVWSSLPASPLTAKAAQAVWTGREALFFGVGDGWQGEAFDPATGAWREIADPPIARRDVPMVVWTGSEMIVWGGGSRTEMQDPPNPTGAAYDPRTNTWRRIADAPIGLNQGNAAWAWPRMVVLGSRLGPDNAASTETAIGAEYDPAHDTWTELPPSSLSPQADSIAAVGRAVIAWDYLGGSQVPVLPVGSAPPDWRPAEHMPVRPTECSPSSAVVQNESSGEVFAWLCGQAAVWDRSREQWFPVPDAPQAGFSPNRPSFAAEDVIGAGRAVLLPPEGDHDWVVWAYRPPSNAPTAAEVAPPTFDPAPGWSTITTAADPSQLHRGSVPTAWASNRPFAEGDLADRTADGSLRSALFPQDSLRALPPDGVLVTAMVYGSTDRPESELPLRLSIAQIQRHWEGQVAPNVPQYLLIGAYQGRLLDVRMYFGTLHPSSATLAAAQSELDRLRVPPGL